MSFRNRLASELVNNATFSHPLHPLAMRYAARVRLAKIFGFQAYMDFDKLTTADLIAIWTIMDVDQELKNG